jgi:alkylated DNA nucleotide flippase Atl1
MTAGAVVLKSVPDKPEEYWFRTVCFKEFGACTILSSTYTIQTTIENLKSRLESLSKRSKQSGRPLTYDEIASLIGAATGAEQTGKKHLSPLSIGAPTSWEQLTSPHLRRSCSSTGSFSNGRETP